MSVPPTASRPAAPVAEPCAACGSPLADDQRYCLQCGEVRSGARRPLPALLRGSIQERATGAPTSAADARGDRGPSLTAALAGLACLLLAMGVGVLIGRGGGSPAAPAPVTITGSPAAAAPVAAAFTSDWPTGKSGWTVALDVLPKASTQPAAIAAAKTAATGKRAPAVGTLDSDAYPSLKAGSYVVYSGVYDAERKATAALAALKVNFAGARVVRVAASASPSSSSSSSSSSRGAGSKRTSSSSAERTSTSGAQDTKKAFEQSKKAPKTVGTGGKPPPKDNKPAGGGGAFQDIG